MYNMYKINNDLLNGFKKEKELLIEIKNEINLNQKKIILIDLIEESSKYHERIDSPLSVEKKYFFDFDLKRNGLISIFDELLDELIKTDFKVNLDIKKNQKEIKKKIDSISHIDINDIELLKIKSLEAKMDDSYHCLHCFENSYEVNILDLLLKKKQMKLILEILISDKVELNQKKYLFNKMVIDYPCLIQIFKNVDYSLYNNMPDLFFQLKEKKYDDFFEEKIDQNIKLIFNDKEENTNIIRDVITAEQKDEMEKIYRRNVVMFFIDNNLIDINEVNWTYKNNTINLAAACLILGDDKLCKYIYSKDDYKNGDKDIKNYSDEIIINRLTNDFISYRSLDLFEIIESNNFENSPEKFKHLINILVKKHTLNPTNISKEKINKIVDILLRKTKKEDKIIIKKYINDLNINIDNDLLIQKRQEITSLLGKVNNSLMEQVPAKTKIKDLKFEKKEDISK